MLLEHLSTHLQLSAKHYMMKILAKGDVRAHKLKKKKKKTVYAQDLDRKDCWFSWLRSSQKHKSNREFPVWPHDGAQTPLTAQVLRESKECGSRREGTPVQGAESLTDLRELVSGPH